MNDEKHAMQHDSLQRQQDRIDRMWQSTYERAKARHVYAPRKLATRYTYSQRVSLYYAWRAHLRTHGTKPSTFATLAELQQMHDELHKVETPC